MLKIKSFKLLFNVIQNIYHTTTSIEVNLNSTRKYRKLQFENKFIYIKTPTQKNEHLKI